MNKERSIFTAIGMSGSGKTTYVLGLHHQMSSGINGFNINSSGDTHKKLQMWDDRLCDAEICDPKDDKKSGQDRFPPGTDREDFEPYDFTLLKDYKEILPFRWSDYAGGLLSDMDDSENNYNKLVESIDVSTVLYIIIDGETVCKEDNAEDRIDLLRLKCANTINYFISDYSMKHNEILPPIVFIVTKVDLCSKKGLTDSDIKEVIKKSFSPVFGGDHISYIVGVSLGMDISDNDYKGKVKPFNIHLPLFIGMFHDFLNYFTLLKLNLDKQFDIYNLNKQDIEKEISQCKSDYEKQAKKIIFKNKKLMKKLQDDIENKKGKIADDSEIIKKQREEKDANRKLFLSVFDVLSKNSNNFAVFHGDTESQFSAADCYDL